MNGGVVARCRFGDDLRLEAVELVPFDWELQAGEFGKLPRTATRGKAREILQRLDELARPFGARVDQREGVGVLRPLSATAVDADASGT